jgi:hypothetical protein
MRRWRRPDDTIGPDQKTGGKSAGLRAWESVVDFQVEHPKKAESSKENQGNDRAQCDLSAFRLDGRPMLGSAIRDDSAGEFTSPV